MTVGRLGWFSLFAWVALGAGASACSEDSSSDASTGGTAGDGGTSGSGGTTTTGGSGGSAGSGGGAGAPSCAGTPAPTDDAKLAAVIGKLHDQLNPLKAPGGAFAIILDGKLTHVAVSGSKVSSTCDPITPETLFRTGQITEVVTTMATLALVEQKKLSLTAPITDAVPSFQAPPGNGLAKDLTLAHLLADRGCYSASAAGAFKCSTLADSVGSANVPLWCVPGSMWSGDIAGYSLAGLAVESKHGKPFATAARELVLDPLKMGGTFEPTEAVKLDHSFGHQDSGFEQKLTGVDCGDLHPATQYHGSIQDVGKLAAALLSGGGGVISSSTLNEVFADHGSDFRSTYFRGLAFTGFQAGEVVWVSGRAAAFRQEMLLLPKQKIGIVTLLNGTSAEPELVNDEFIAQYASAPVPWPSKTYVPATADVQSLVGTYEDALGFKGVQKRTLEVSLNGSDLQAKLVESAETGTLLPVWSKDNFELTLGGETRSLRFWRDTSGVPFAAAFPPEGGPAFYRKP
ncbi:MAG: hypothetical protein AMXMBFR56_79930 [Polyangiaceae bacterium]